MLKFYRCQIPKLAKIYTFSERSIVQGTLPLPIQTHRNSQALANSVKFRSIAFWRTLPQDWDVNSASLTKFKVMVYDFLISKRKLTVVQC